MDAEGAIDVVDAEGEDFKILRLPQFINSYHTSLIIDDEIGFIRGKIKICHV